MFQLEKLVLKSQDMYLKYRKNQANIRKVQKRRENLCRQVCTEYFHCFIFPKLYTDMTAVCSFDSTLLLTTVRSQTLVLTSQIFLTISH